MQIRSLKTHNWLGLPAFSHAFGQINLIAGPNGSGKSSVQDAIKFALLGGRLRGVAKKTELPTLITDGAKEGTVTIDVDGNVYTRAIKTGECKSSTPRVHEALPYVLDAQRFASLPVADRRKFLYDLMGVETDPAATCEQLADLGVTADVIAAVKPMLRSGFDAAEKFATEKAAESRGAWKSITGEVYGSQKAEDWSPGAAPIAPTPDELATAAQAENDADREHGSILQHLGAMRARAATAPHPEVQAARDGIEGWRTQLANGEAKKATLDAEIPELAEKAKSPGGTYGMCPQCSCSLEVDGGVIRKAIAPNGDQLEAFKRLPIAKDELASIETGIGKVRAKIARAETLIAEADRPDESEAIAEFEGKLRTAAMALATAREHRAALTQMQRDSVAASSSSERAAAAHAAVKAWKEVADQLSPSGIPGALLAKVLDPINNRLRQSSQRTGWPQVTIDADMAVLRSGRAYALCSESEQWRADAMVAEAIANLSGLRLLMLDRLDVLDTPARGQAVTWLQSIADDYSTVIVSGTLKAPPEIEGIKTIWLGELPDMAAAA